MIKIGITGGIGSGKSVISKIFQLNGIPVYNADEEAKRLNDSSVYIREQLSLHFGNDLYIEDKLDRKKLASLIFHDENKLAIVNSIIHPELARHFTEWCRQQENHPIVALDAALLIEAGFYRLVDKVIVVHAPKELRIARVIQRDHSSRGDVEARINSQLPEKEKLKYADHIIYNDESNSLILQVSKLLENIKAKR